MPGGHDLPAMVLRGGVMCNIASGRGVCRLVGGGRVESRPRDTVRSGDGTDHET